MKYDFDKVVDRTKNHSAKYDERMKRFGREDVIPLWIADMDFQVAAPILEAMEEKVKQGIFGYVSKPEEYWDALCGWQERRNGWKVDKSLLSFTVGIVPALAAFAKQFGNPGDEILIQTPVYPEFYEVIEDAGCHVLSNPLDYGVDGYSINFEDFEEKLKRGPKAFILCNPQNPIGRVWTREELKKMGELCLSYGVPVISDEIHGDLMLWGSKHTVMASISPQIAANTITCTAASKTFNLAGLHAAAVVFNNQDEKQKFDAFWQKLEIHRNNCFGLVATMAAYHHGEEWLTQLLPYIEGNMTFVHQYCEAYIPRVKPNLPQCTYLMWIDCSGLGMADEELNQFMVEKAGLGLNMGNAFDSNLSGYVRLNAACPRSVLKQAMEQLRNAVDAL